MAKFITFEGPEGAGKTTLISVIGDTLKRENHEVLLAKEPGGTVIGEELRKIVKYSKEPVSLETELLLFSAARSQLVNQVFIPFNNKYKNGVILCDRFIDSTTAYQGYGKGYDLSKINQIHNISIGSFVPNLTLLLDLPVEIGLQRAGKRNEGNDRFETEKIDFHNKVRKGYLRLAKNNAGRFYVLDATKKPEEVYQEAMDILKYKLGI